MNEDNICYKLVVHMTPNQIFAAEVSETHMTHYVLWICGEKTLSLKQVGRSIRLNYFSSFQIKSFLIMPTFKEIEDERIKAMVRIILHNPDHVRHASRGTYGEKYWEQFDHPAFAGIKKRQVYNIFNKNR